MGATMQGKTGIARKDTYRVLHLHLRIWRAASIELSLSADRIVALLQSSQKEKLRDRDRCASRPKAMQAARCARRHR